MRSNEKQSVNYLETLHWDQLAVKLVLNLDDGVPHRIEGMKIVPPGMVKIVIKRDKNYRLIGRIYAQETYQKSTEFTRPLIENWNLSTKGALLEVDTVIIEHLNSIYQIEHFAIVGLRDARPIFKAKTVADSIINYSVQFHLSSIESIIKRYWVVSKNPSRKHELIERDDKERGVFIDWIVNAPSAELAYIPRVSKTESSVSFKFRTNQSQETLTHELGRESNANDHFRFQYAEFQVTVRFFMDKTVRDCRTLAIEYWCRNGAIPTAEHRKTLVEFLSFVFGRHLQHVGHSFFLTDTPTTTLVQYSARNPWRDDLRALALETSEPPIDFSSLLFEAEEEEDSDSPSSKFELFVETYLPKYRQARTESSLIDLLWGLWVARMLPDEERLPIYSSALEKVAKAFLKSKNIEMQCLPKTTFSFLCEELKAMLRQTIKRNQLDQIENEQKTKAQISFFENKIDRLNDFGPGVRIREFYNAIKLERSPQERKAMDMRHSAAHGDRTIESGQSAKNEYSVYSASYMILLYRTFLRILGYEGVYTDYSTPDYPSRLLKVPSGEA